MLTIFSTPKPFRGHIGIIQRNAITSWTLLRPAPEIILFGDEEGTHNIANELGVHHAPQLKRNEYGTPLFDHLVAEARRLASHELLCYVNADILLPEGLTGAVSTVSQEWKKFLIVCQRINVDVREPIPFPAEWTALAKKLEQTGQDGSHTAIDLFVFPKSTYPQVPPFGIGRLWFDQWLIKAARQAGTPVVDISRVAQAIHQNHGYNHVRGGAAWIYGGAEAEYNLKLYGGTPQAFTLLDVTHELLPDGRIRRVRFRRLIFEVQQILWRVFIEKTAQVRRYLGLRRRAWRRVARDHPTAQA